MAIWGMGVMIGPIMGPTLGGYLTDHYNWRWVFYINLPFGLLAAAGLLFFLPNVRGNQLLPLRLARVRRALRRHRRFAVDAGPRPGPGLVLRAGDHRRGDILAGLGFYLFTVHMFSARHPLMHPALFARRQFLVQS